MNQIVAQRTERSSVKERQTKWSFLDRMIVGEKRLVSIREMTEAEAWRALRSLRNVCSHRKRFFARVYKSAMTKAGIQVERLA